MLSVFPALTTRKNTVNTMFRINPGIKWRWEGDKILLNTFMSMNKTAGEVLDLYKELNEPHLIVKAVKEKYPDMPHEAIDRDIHALIEQFKKWRIVVPEGSSDYSVPVVSNFMEYVNHVFNNRLSAPVQVACEITTACNACCPHCSGYSVGNNELTTEEWKNLIDHISCMGVFTVTFTGGEPLLRKDLEELVTYAANKGLHVIIATNGFELNEEKVQVLSAAGVKTVMISIDGPDPETHDAFRGLPESFARAVKAVRLLQEKGIGVVILTAVTQVNVKKIPEIIAVTDRIGATFLDLMRLVPIGRAEKSSLEPSFEDYLELLPKIREKEREYPQLHIEYPNLPAVLFKNTVGLDYYEELKSENRIEIGGAGIVICTVDPCGNVKLCDFPLELTLGNVREHGLQLLWDNAAVFRYVREGGGTTPYAPCVLGDVCIVRYKSFSIPDGEQALQNTFCEQCYTTFTKEVSTHG